MKIADLAHVRMPANPTISPDGRNVVVSLSSIDLEKDRYRSELWIMPTDGSQPPRRLTHGPSDSQPLYSPDGRWLAFVRAPEGGKSQVHVMPTDGGEPRALTDHPLGADSLAWSPDSTRIAHIARVPEKGRYGTDSDITPEKEPPRRITSRKYRVDNLGFTNDRRPQLFVVSLDEGAEPVQLTEGDYDHAAPEWSPDGSQLLFAAARHADRESDVITDLHLIPAEGGEVHTLTDSSVTAGAGKFVGDDVVVFFADSDPDVVGRNVRLWTVGLAGGQTPEPLTDRERYHLDGYGTGSRQPLLVDGDAVITQNQNRGAVELVRVPLDGSEPAVVVGGQRQVLGADRVDDLTIMLVATDRSAGEVVALRGGEETVLSDFGAALSDATDLRPMVEVDTQAPDGYPVHGWVVKPDGDGPFPVLLAIHGGPFTQYGWDLYDEAQVYAGAGYAVVMGNPRGASGYGEAHGRSIVGDMGNLDRADLLALLDHVLADPDLDASRVGVMGGSYGGFMTTLLSGTEAERFRGSISERSVNVWDSFTGSSDIGWFFTDSYCGSDPERQHAQSPLTYADGITQPMLIIHSEHDWRCPVEQAQRLFERLQRNGVESEMLLFPGEGHELSRSGLPSHRVARFEAILDWWARHLKGQSEGEGSTASDASGDTSGRDT